MSKPSETKIETAGIAGRFTPEQLRQKTAESRAYWSSSAGKARQSHLDAENRNRKTPPARFRTVGTKPILAGHISRPHLAL